MDGWSGRWWAEGSGGRWENRHPPTIATNLFPVRQTPPPITTTTTFIEHSPPIPIMIPITTSTTLTQVTVTNRSNAEPSIHTECRTELRCRYKSCVGEVLVQVIPISFVLCVSGESVGEGGESTKHHLPLKHGFHYVDPSDIRIESCCRNYMCLFSKRCT